MNLSAVKVERKDGAETFSSRGQSLPLNLIDFWRWSASDLANNAARGVLAEWIVASALGLDNGVRVEWDAFDLLAPGARCGQGTKIEVKSSAYLQSWAQEKLSAIQFDIRPTRAWDPATNAYDLAALRQADIYVFCLLKHQDKLTLDPMNFDQWEFFVLRAQTLNEQCGTQKTLGLAALKKLAPRSVNYENLAANIAELGAASTCSVL